MSTMTFYVDTPNGLDSRLLFPGMYPHTFQVLNGVSPLNTQILHFPSGPPAPSIRYELTFFSLDLDPIFTQSALIHAAILYSAPVGQPRVQLMSAAVELDGAAAEQGGIRLNSMFNFTPDTLISGARMQGPINLAFVGNVGNDYLSGSYADDMLRGGAGADVLDGHQGNDTASYQGSNAGVVINLATGVAKFGHATGDKFASIESLVGTDFVDILTGDDGNNTLSGGMGDDKIYGGFGDDKLVGDGGKDTLYGENGGDEMYGGDDDDRVYGGAGNDALLGEAGADRLYGDDGSDGMFGGDGADRLYGGADNDFLDGGDGNDILDGGEGQDTMIGGYGADTMYVDNAGDAVFDDFTGDGDRVVISVSYALAAGAQIERMEFISAASTVDIDLSGNAASQAIYGNAGNNVIDGGGGVDLMTGFGGDDRYLVDDAADRPIEAVGGGTDEVLASASFALKAGTEIERLATTDAAGSYGLTLTGNEFGQTVEGNAGSNTLNGKGGNDTLLGFAGNDIFLFDTPLGAGNIDLIQDFSVTDDTIGLARRIFAGIGTAGPLAASRFVTGAAAQDATDRIIYNSSSGALLYDADGAGGAAAIQFASVQAGLALTHNDFVLM